ncbi:hypothetical protein B4140_0160 [Bacillus amyloliquefaciens]|nr:hypothetical protein B4140_0160 [Bacillus amyloliquefaciens]
MRSGNLFLFTKNLSSQSYQGFSPTHVHGIIFKPIKTQK